MKIFKINVNSPTLFILGNVLQTSGGQYLMYKYVLCLYSTQTHHKQIYRLASTEFILTNLSDHHSNLIIMIAVLLE